MLTSVVPVAAIARNLPSRSAGVNSRCSHVIEPSAASSRVRRSRRGRSGSRGRRRRAGPRPSPDRPHRRPRPGSCARRAAGRRCRRASRASLGRSSGRRPLAGTDRRIPYPDRTEPAWLQSLVRAVRRPPRGASRGPRAHLGAVPDPLLLSRRNEADHHGEEQLGEEDRRHPLRRRSEGRRHLQGAVLYLDRRRRRADDRRAQGPRDGRRLPGRLFELAGDRPPRPDRRAAGGEPTDKNVVKAVRKLAKEAELDRDRDRLRPRGRADRARGAAAGARRQPKSSATARPAPSSARAGRRSSGPATRP